MVKLSIKDVYLIRRSDQTCRKIAEEFGVSPSMVNMIQSGRKYSWLPPEEDLSPAERVLYLGEERTIQANDFVKAFHTFVQRAPI
jgi:hypothetical protein